jgi:hypothetical protein
VFDSIVGLDDEAAIDAKIISLSSSERDAWIIGAPTYGGRANIQPFRYSTSPFDIPHEGINDLLDFSWMRSSEVYTGASEPPPFLLPTGSSADVVFSAQYKTAAYNESALKNTIIDVARDTLIGLGGSSSSIPAPPEESSAVRVSYAQQEAQPVYSIAFQFQPPFQALLTNLMLSAPRSALAASGLSQLTSRRSHSSADAPQKYWWIGAAVGGIAVVGVVMIVAIKSYRKKRWTKHNEEVGLVAVN